MAISDKITSITNHLIDDYKALENLGADLTNVDKNIENIKSVAEQIYDNLPKTEYQEGTEVNLGVTLKGKLDYENGVVGIGQSSQDSTQGYNIVNTLNFSTTTINGVTCTNNGDGTFTINGTATADTNFNLINGNNVVNWSAGTYKLLGQPSGDSGWDKFILYFNNWDGINCYSGQTKTLSSATTSLSLIIRIGNGKTYNNLTFFPMITTNTSLTNDDCEQYTGGQASPNPSYPQTINSVTGNQDVVVSGKNIFDGELELGTYNSDTGAKDNASSNYRNKNFIKVKPDTTYTTSINGVSQRYCVYYYNSSKTLISWTSQLTTGTFTTPPNTEYVNFRCFISDFTSDFANLKVQMEQGSSATSYEPYITPTSYQLSLGDIKLNSIGNYKDYIFKNLTNNKWYLHKEVGKVTFNGTETWYIQITQDYTRVDTRDIPNLLHQASRQECYSNYFKFSSTTAIHKIGDMFAYWINNGSIYLYPSADITSVDEFKQWLSTHNTSVYYIFETPTDTEITNTTLISQLNNWYNAHSLNGTTIITSNGDLPMIIKVRGLKGE